MTSSPSPKPFDGLVHSVSGAISPDQLGVTLTHQHLIYVNPGYDQLLDTSLVEQGVRRFGRRGGKTIVEVSCAGLRKSNDLSFFYHLAQATGVNIVASVGYYKFANAAKTPGVDTSLRAETYADQMEEELIRGGICPVEGEPSRRIWGGIIGEVGITAGNVLDGPTGGWGGSVSGSFEKRSVRGAGLAHKRTGAPIILHFDGIQIAQTEATLRILCDECGVAGARIAVSHRNTSSDKAVFEDDVRLAKERGVYVEYDWFILDELAGGFDIRAATAYLLMLFDRGVGERVLLSPDVLNDDQLRHYGYEHSLDLLEKMMAHGLTQKHWDQILIRNPAAYLPWKR